jgi:hypothetical protein
LKLLFFCLEMYGNDKGVPATFQVIYFIGWRPHPSQVLYT